LPLTKKTAAQGVQRLNNNQNNANIMKNLELLRTPLKINEIDFRVQSINNGKYATILAYKDARVDMNRLDDVVGAAYWKREHFDGNTRCRVSIWNENINEWVGKEDVGTQSITEKEKGLASDSFKRACFNLGIGRELYDYPQISILLKENEVQLTGQDRPKYRATFDLKIKEWKWVSVFNENKIVGLFAKDQNNVLRYSWGVSSITIPGSPLLDIPRLNNRLNACNTMSELQTAYKAFTPAEQAATAATKDAMKLKLS
jgi:hypothetical protein